MSPLKLETERHSCGHPSLSAGPLELHKRAKQDRDKTPTTQQASATMDVDDDGSGVGGSAAAAQPSEAERFALLKAAVKDFPGDYGAHLALVEYLRRERPGSLELLKARQE